MEKLKDNNYSIKTDKEILDITLSYFKLFEKEFEVSEEAAFAFSRET